MADKLSTAATLEGVGLYKDGSISLRFVTQEASPEDLLFVKRFHGHFGTLLFSESKLQPSDIPEQNPDFEGKTPSKRLRNVIFVLWDYLKSQNKTKLKFEDFYTGQIERIIEQYKLKLPSR